MPAPTDAERLRRRDSMRRLRLRRAKAATRIAQTAAWSFESICAAVGLHPSPQSQLNPARWLAPISYDGMSYIRSHRPSSETDDSEPS